MSLSPTQMNTWQPAMTYSKWLLALLMTQVSAWQSSPENLSRTYSGNLISLTMKPSTMTLSLFYQYSQV